MLLLLRQSLSHQVVADADLAFQDEVHVRNLVLLVQNEPVLQLNVKLGRLESKAHFKQKVLVIHLICLATRNEERPESENDVIKQVVQQDVILDLFGALIHILIVNFHLVQPILTPIV